MAEPDVVIVGGGLAGLTASAILAKAGKQVVLMEKAAVLGGRSQTQNQSGFQLNFGPHALYKGGIAARTYRELGLKIVGGEPIIARGAIYSRDTLEAIPFNPLALLRSSLFTWAEKWEMLRLLKRVTSLNPDAQQGQSVADWLVANVRGESVKAFLQAVLRLSTYCADLELLDAGLAFEQFQLSLGGVLYLDRGWQTLVDGLVGISQQFGVKLLTAQKISQVDATGSFPTVELANGNTISASHLVLATDPTTIQQLLRVEIPTISIRAACLDLALRRLPIPDRSFVLALDSPFYYSVHSAYSKLAPESGAVVHVARYLCHDEDIPAPELRSQLEAFLERLQPGWQQEVVHARFMPNAIVVQDLPGRKSIDTEIMPSIYLVGDWVGDQGMLSDRAVASAIDAANHIIHQS